MQLIDKISPKKLRELYWRQKMSSPEIASVYYITPEHVRLLLRKYGIRIRSKSEAMKIFEGVEVSKKELKKLYLNNKMTIYEIAKKFNCCPGTIYKRLIEYKIPVRTLKEAWTLKKSRYPQKNFSNNLKEKAYLMGFSVGDLHVHSRSETSPTIFIDTNSTRPEQIQLFERLFSPYGHIWKGRPDKNGAISIRCSLNRSFGFLLNKKDLIEPWIFENANLFTAYLAGYIDAEGSFYLCDNNGVFCINSQDKNILRQIYFKLISLNIFGTPPRLICKRGERRGKFINHKDLYCFRIYRKDALLELIEAINPYSKHADKRKAMGIVKNNVLERNRKYNNQQDRRYYKLYLNEGIKI